MSRSILVKTLFGLTTIYVFLSYSWIHGAAAAVLAEDCDSDIVTQSSIRVTELMGTAESRPIIACLNTPRVGINISHGQTRFALGLPPLVLIGPEGINEDVISHELVHAELATRLGLLKRAWMLPTWFDEGMAMQVDHRLDYNLQALRRFQSRGDLQYPALDEIASSAFFVAGDQGKYHYAYSKCLVAHWIEKEHGSPVELTWRLDLSQTDAKVAAAEAACVRTP